MVRINTDLPALMAWRQMEIAQKGAFTNMDSPATGLRIRASDDPARPEISEKMRTQSRGHNQTICNVQGMISSLQTVEDPLDKVYSLLHHVKELLLFALSNTRSSLDYMEIQKEISQLLQKVDYVVLKTRLSTRKLPQETVFTPSNTEALGISTLLPLDRESADRLLEKIDEAIARVSSERISPGAMVSQLQNDRENLYTRMENFTVSESLIRDEDRAFKSLNQAKDQIRWETSLAMLAQANLNHQRVFRLLFY